MKHQHQTFILGMIKHGDKIHAYRAAYPKCADDETARKSAERLLRHHPAVAAEIEESTAYIRQRAYTEAYQQHMAQQKTPLLSMMKRREILAQIATCEMKVTRFVKNGDRYRMLFEDPRPRDIMKAIELDAKLEDACNRLRNCNDPVLSQFNIYIDGRPCDQPHLPPDPNLPPGIYMLPRSRKNYIDKTGIQMEQNQITSPHSGDLGVQLAQDKNMNPETNLMPQIENQNPGIKTEQNKEAPRLPVPPVRDLGELVPPRREENGEMPMGMSHSGEVDSRRTPAQEKPNTPLHPVDRGQGVRSLEQNPDPLAASFYKEDLQARAAAPPPHIFTPEEVKALDEEYTQQHKGKPVKPSTFGKMYFKEKGANYDNIE